MKTIEIQRQFEKNAAATDQPVITIMGWVRTIRKQKKCAFLQVNDGSTLAGLQCVVTIDESDENSDTNKILDGITTGAAVELHGTIIASLGGRQAYELAVTYVSVIGNCPGETYPLAKKRHSLEYLRTLAHLRPRTNTIAAIARVRSQLAGAIHSFFQSRGVLFLQTPLITSSDCEGAGEMFRVTTLDIDLPDQLPVVKPKSSDKKKKEKKNDDETTSSVAAAAATTAETDPPQSQSPNMPRRFLDVSQDFFAKPAYLTVSGQLAAETYACALGDVYTFGPTFRAENSQTTRHLAEFHMVEPEYAFCDLNGVMDKAEEMLQHVVRHVLKHCPEDLAFFNEFYDKNLLERLQKLVDEPFARVSYRRAVRLLREEIARDPTKWQFPNVTFGTDLATEHERWLAESKFQTAVFVYNYPKSIKSFYMRDNDDDGGGGDANDDDNDDNTKDTVAATDLLVPGVGELIGGSQREDRLDVLVHKMEELGLNVDDYWWYLDLRRYGSVPHAGYGLGFERLVTYVCGMENIREAIAFPRYPGNAEF
jgi:asparaginyl-tRNA synthetase